MSTRRTLAASLTVTAHLCLSGGQGESGPQVFLSTGPVEQPSAPELELWLTQEALTQSGRSLPFVLGNPSSPTFLTSMRTD